MKVFYALIFAFAPLFSFGQCTVTISSLDNACFGSTAGSATASSTGAQPFTYLWSPGNQTTASINGLASGTYTVTMTDALSCVSTATVTITSPPQMTATISSVAPSCGNCCNGSASIAVTGGVGPYTYLWTPNNYTSSSITNLCAGTYSCCATDVNGCSTCNPNGCPFCQTSVNLSPATGVSEDPVFPGFVVFPNPATTSITITETFSEPVSAEIRVLNVLGEMLLSRSEGAIINLNIILNVSSLPAGVYFITISTVSGTSIKKIVRE
ncbi:MAG: T9SS type A sorting domain-containing protein [Bacteroidia bacterium]